MKYSEILPDALAGNPVRNTNYSHNWFVMGEDGYFHYEDSSEGGWIPDREAYKQDTWEVKLEIPEEIFVWGDTDDDGESFLHVDEPEYKDFEWISHGTLRMEETNVFPSGKPTKYKLISVEEITVQNQHEHIQGNKGIDMSDKKPMDFEKWNHSELFSAHEESHKFVQGGWLKDVELRMQIADVVNRERYKAWNAALEQDKIRRGEA